MSNKSVSASDAVKLASQMMSLLSTCDACLDKNEYFLDSKTSNYPPAADAIGQLQHQGTIVIRDY